MLHLFEKYFTIGMLIFLCLNLFSNTLAQQFQFSAFACPEDCICNRAELLVSCSSANLKSVPSYIPYWTRKLDLTKNNIKNIKESDFDNVPDLVELDLSENSNSFHDDIKFTEMVFNKLKKLQVLNLSGNRLRSLPDDIFQGLQNLSVLRLEDNQLFSLPKSIFKVKLVEVYLENNPFICSCDLYNFVALVRNITEINSLPPACTDIKTSIDDKLRLDMIKSKYNCEPLTLESDDGFRQDREISPPFITHSLPVVTMKTEGQTAHFQCEADGNPQPFITWYRDEVLLTERIINLFIKYTQRGSTIKLKEVSKKDEGVYKCVAVNRFGKSESTGTLKLVTKRKPQIAHKPADQDAVEGSNVTLFCEASGFPVPQIKWLRSNINVEMLTSNRKYLIEGSQLTIFNITKEDGKGLYMCTAQSELGSVEATAAIRVVDKAEMMPDKKMSDMNMSKKNSSFSSGSSSISKTDVINQVIEKAKYEVKKAINETLTKLRDYTQRRSVSDIVTIFRLPNEAAIELSTAAEIYERTIEEINRILRQNNMFNFSSSDVVTENLLDPEQLAIVSRLSGCSKPKEEIDCSFKICFHQKYRTLDGTCNNFKNPRWGAALYPFIRKLLPQYENMLNQPIGWNLNRLYHGYPKPSARWVSNELIGKDDITQDDTYTLLLMQWGQFLDHDLTFTPADASNRRFSDGTSCNETCVNESPCFPIIRPPNDKPFSGEQPCIGFIRSSSTCGSGTSSILLGQPHYREQINQITAYLDASNVYGSGDIEADILRETQFDEGMLKVGIQTVTGGKMLPFNTRSPVDCQIDPLHVHVPCFIAGDHRANENLGLLAMHTLWVRYHNFVVSRLRGLNPHWSGDRLYHEGRKIVGAVMQHITYEQWLPIILGPEGMKKLEQYKGYNDSVNPSISNVFATSAFRFGHTLIMPKFLIANENWEVTANISLHKSFFAPHRFMEFGGLDPMMRGLMLSSAKKVMAEEPMTTELTDRLFKLAHKVANDLAAFNIQRGRDHGLPGYADWRKMCNLKYPEKFDDLRWDIPNPDIREKLRQLYGHPGNIDLFAGSVLEQIVPGAKVGPTFACLIIDQFKRLRDGDRFWYENPEVFTHAQIAQIKQSSLARVICDGSENIKFTQPDVFRKVNSVEEFVPCQTIPKINFGPWRDCAANGNERVNDVLFNPSGGQQRFRRSSQETCGNSRDNQEMLDKLETRIKNLETQLEEMKKTNN